MKKVFGYVIGVCNLAIVCTAISAGGYAGMQLVDYGIKKLDEKKRKKKEVEE